MARKLKTYQTSLGFFDMAIAAPSMKAALEAWGSKSNLFHQGFAREVDDPDVIAATISKPGIILRRPVGSDGPFKQDAELPSDLSREEVKDRPKKHRAKPGKRSPRKMNDRAGRTAASGYERAQRQRESQRRKEETARAKERERREQAIAKAQAAIEEAERAHEQRAGGIDTERAALERRSQAEDERWEKQKEKLGIALRRARG
ncbi:MAG: cell envelope biogenesis protein TolA [Bradyrhizobium sp.]|uniref:cell envelope biogenesis protein TolA n=1 Tax=Bradyrhizobium sp. TaxID=376 RepID=UPI00271F2FA8|nr:cell envelope biogenesis protein TolA [Bradyrhizobium sp.]MDO8397430.1 cell envelope biogenesis protein TolA [Bradyrhizobium sp.]